MMELNSFDFNVPVHLLFGEGVLSRLHEQAMPGTKALVVISNGRSTRANGYLDRLIAELDAAGVGHVLFDGVGPSPTKEAAEEGAHKIRAEGCDFVVALGGGSVMDAAKAMAMFAVQPSDDLWDFTGGITGKGLRPSVPPLPWVAVTTTAGTGSEVDTGAFISRVETAEKLLVFSDYARIAVVDPELMLTVPPKLTAYQGFDALFHSLEGFISNGTNLMAERLQLAAIENVATYLPTAVADGSNLEARTRLAFANTMSGYSMDFAGCISEHSIEHSLSAFNPKLPHGAGLIMISLAFFDFYAGTHAVDDRLVTMARALGLADAAAPGDIHEALRRLQVACGVDDLRLSDYGFSREDMPKVARNVMDTDGVFHFDPVHIGYDDVLGILECSYR